MSGLDPSDYPAYTAHMGGSKSTKLMGFGNRPALLIVDACPAYFSTSSPLYLGESEAPRSIKKLVASARRGKIPIIWTQTTYTHSKMNDAGLLAHKMAGLEAFSVHDHRKLGAWLTEFGLEPEVYENGEITLFRKFPSAFFGTNFSTQLQALNVDTLVICGACTGGSVRATTLDAMQSGFRAMVVREACADRSREANFANLFDLDAKYADVVCEKEVCNKMESGWHV